MTYQTWKFGKAIRPLGLLQIRSIYSIMNFQTYTYQVYGRRHIAGLVLNVGYITTDLQLDKKGHLFTEVTVIIKVSSCIPNCTIPRIRAFSVNHNKHKIIKTFQITAIKKNNNRYRHIKQCWDLNVSHSTMPTQHKNFYLITSLLVSPFIIAVRQHFPFRGYESTPKM